MPGAGRRSATEATPPGGGSGSDVQKAEAAALAANVVPHHRVLARGGDLRSLAAALNNGGVRTARGGRWHISNVENLVDRLPA